MGGVALPSWFTADDAAYLSGGVVEADPAAYASLEGFSSGEFQIAAEDAVGNCIPMKATALLANAALQRSASRLRMRSLAGSATPLSMARLLRRCRVGTVCSK